MGRVGRFILKVAAVLILIVSAGTFALSLFTGETRNGDNLQSEFDYLITVGISQSGEESSWKDANTASFMDTFVKSNGYEAVYADAGSDQEKQIEDVEGFIKQGVDYIILNPISEIGWDDVLEDAKKAHIPVGVETFREDSIQYGYPHSVTLEVFQSPFLDVSIVTCLLCLIDDVDGFLFSQTVFQLLIVQFSLLEDERKFLVFNKVNQRVEACSILLVM